MSGDSYHVRFFPPYVRRFPRYFLLFCANLDARGQVTSARRAGAIRDSEKIAKIERTN
jgi:hypothetical protein